MPEGIQRLLAELKAGLVKLYGKRLKGVYLFGSYARGDQDSQSDVDVLIVLSHYDRYPLEIQHTSELIGALSLEYSCVISRVFVREADYLEGDTPLLRNVHREAISV
jgi:uncharacterized protein